MEMFCSSKQRHKACCFEDRKRKKEKKKEKERKTETKRNTKNKKKRRFVFCWF